MLNITLNMSAKWWKMLFYKFSDVLTVIVQILSEADIKAELKAQQICWENPCENKGERVQE